MVWSPLFFNTTWTLLYKLSSFSEEPSRPFFGCWLLFVLLSVMMISHCFSNVEIQVLERPIQYWECFIIPLLRYAGSTEKESLALGKQNMKKWRVGSSLLQSIVDNNIFSCLILFVYNFLGFIFSIFICFYIFLKNCMLRIYCYTYK